MTRWGEIKCPKCEELEKAGISDAAIAQARRYYMHVQEGGTLTARDVGRMVEAMEAMQAKLAQQGNLVQAAVAAVLMEVDKAIQAVADNCTTEDGHLAIVAAVEKVRSFMPQDAQAALDRVVAAERERIALHFEAKLKRGEFADSGADELENCIVRIRKGGE